MTIRKGKSHRKFSYDDYPGFKYAGTETGYSPKWTKRHVGVGELAAIKAAAHRDHFNVEVRDWRSTRSNNYRDFFLANYGAGPWRCAYCGRWVKADVGKEGMPRMTVDHVVPVAVSNTGRGQSALALLGAEGVNDVRNLVPACGRCNSSKGPKMGLWVFKAAMSRFRWWWPVCRVLQAIAVIAILCVAFTVLQVRG